MQHTLHDARAETEMEMTPMIDVTFLLLIFFLCTIKFRTLEGKLSAYLPQDVGVNPDPGEPREKVEIRIQVVREGEKRDPRDLTEPWRGVGRFEYVGRERTFFLGPRKMTDLDDLGEQLERLLRSDPARPATIAPLPGTVYGDVVPVLDRVIGAGYTDISFVGESRG